MRLHVHDWRHFSSVTATSALLLMVVMGVFFNANLRSVEGIPSSNMLAVPYHSQGESLSSNGDEYCGVASFQMVLQYISGKVVSQLTLANELGTDYDSGTYTWKVVNAFVNRGYPLVNHQNSNLNGLKQLNAEGYATIISIWYDSHHKGTHSVVVTGYNETGIFVNDPWPLRWEQSADRKSGPNAFISSSLLANLWAAYSEAAVIVPYPAYALSTTSTTSTSILPSWILIIEGWKWMELGWCVK